MTVEALNRWIIFLSSVACLSTMLVVYLNYLKNDLTEANSAAQRSTIVQLRALAATIRSGELDLLLIALKAPHVANAEIAPVMPRHVVALARDDASFVRFVSRDGRMFDPKDDMREIRLTYQSEEASPLIGESVASLAGYRLLALDVSDVIEIANLHADRPVAVRWIFRVNNVEVAQGEKQFDRPAELGHGEVRIDGMAPREAKARHNKQASIHSASEQPRPSQLNPVLGRQVVGREVFV